MIKFRYDKERVYNGVYRYNLYAKGSGIGSGISWTWIGTFADFQHMKMMRKAIKEN